ncbi:MAG: hypothetical protein QXL67_00835 [Candidatus Bathyarchaeia archaeon]
MSGSEVCPHAKDDPDLQISKICGLDGLCCPPECFRKFKKCFLYNSQK